jgi:4-carboxymuconolactone decarboxylase
MSEKTELGLRTMDTVYGTGFTQAIPDVSTPMLEDTIDHLFGEIWSRPGLSIRDRRLLVMGATAALGRADLIEIQARGALENNELSPGELREAVLQLHYYVGWGNGTQVNQGIEAAISSRETQSSPASKEHNQ